MRRLPAALLALLCAGPCGFRASASAAGAASDGAPLPRLAQRLADELLRASAGRALELPEIETRDARPALALDLRALLLARLAGRATLTASGARLRAEALLSQAERRLVASARLVEEPGGRLVDIVSVSVEADPALVPIATDGAQTSAALELVARTRSTPVEGPVLDLALVGDERVLVLVPEALALHRWNGQELTLESRQALPGPAGAVRRPGGLLLPAAHEGSVWAASSAVSQAVLFELRGGRLAERGRAAAVPWKDAPQGLRYRPGTDWLQGPLPGLGPGPFLALEPGLPDLALSTSAELLVAGAGGPQATGLRAGPALAALWDGLFVAASPAPPEARERLLIFVRDGSGVRAAAAPALELHGAVRALAARAGGGAARLVAAVEEPGGRTYLELFELRRPEPQP